MFIITLPSIGPAYIYVIAILGFVGLLLINHFWQNIGSCILWIAVGLVTLILFARKKLLLAWYNVRELCKDIYYFCSVISDESRREREQIRYNAFGIPNLKKGRKK